MKKILVVDDDESILDAVSLVLEQEGFSVDTTYSGEGTYKKIENFSPDLILLDVLLSGVDGRTICKNLKNKVNTQNIPIIMISAHPSAKENIKEYGANDFLAKPFEIKELVDKINNHI